jgi:hypothetical protein
LNQKRFYFSLSKQEKKNMKKVMAPFIIILTLILAACAPAQSTSVDSYSMEAPAPMGVPAVAGEQAQNFVADTTASGTSIGDSTLPATERIVIKNAQITIVVDDPAAAMNAILQLADQKSGFVVSSNLYKSQTEQGMEIPQAAVTIRVPADTLNDSMDAIRALVKDPTKDIQSENISGQDFTQEYTDLQSRKTNLENAVEQLTSIMNQATKTEDVLAVYQQLTQVSGDLEIVKGQIQYYEESSHFSSISITILAQAGVSPLSIGGWQPAGIAKDAIQTLIDALKIVANIGIWLVLFLLPLGIVLLIPVVIIYFIVRRIVKRRKAAQQKSSDISKEQTPLS